MINKEIPIFFTIDDGYAPFLSVALNSAIKNSSTLNRYKAIVLHQDLSDENKRRLKALETEHFAVDFIPMQSGLESITDRMSNRLRCDYFTLTIYFRLFIATMFPQYDKGVYIDSDVVLTGDVAELYGIDIGDNLIGACADKSVVEVPELANYMENAVGVDRHEYINSGVLLMNLKKLREVRFDEHFLNLLNTYHFDCIAPDQDYLNAICNGKIHYLDEQWDAMPNDGQPPLERAKLIHYNLFAKPWCYDNIQYGDLFWHYAEDSGYYDEIRAYKDGYSDEQKASDSQCMGLLLSRGDSIPEQEVTFKKMAESGVKIRL
ncbi:MAG: glycosyltransferase family 8 protein [Firmicutes bacterium]|nr:glycosyltransferase family 8 protein [Bacillota bacterium]